MAKIKGTTGVGATIAPASDTSKFPATSEQWHKGGYKSFESIAERDAMLESYKKEGMLIRIKELNVFQILENDEWVNISFGDGGAMDLSQYAKKSDIPAEQIAQLEQDIDDLLDITNQKADKSEVDELKAQIQGQSGDIDTSAFATKDEVEQKADKSEVDELKEQIQGQSTQGASIDTSNLATKDEVNAKLDTSTYENEKADFALKSELPQAQDISSLATKDELEQSAQTLNNALVLKADKSEVDELKEQVTQGGNADLSEYVKKAELDEFDPNELKDELQNVIDAAKAELLTIDKLDEFSPNDFINELNKVIENARAELAVLDSLTEIDMDELKAGIMADILAEMGGA